MTDCPYCGDALISFVDEVEDSRFHYVTLCPTCYRYLSVDDRVVVGPVIGDLAEGSYAFDGSPGRCHNLAPLFQASICEDVAIEYPYRNG
jgi:hypothetical protein